MPVARRSHYFPPPSDTTLKRYGLTEADWFAMCRRQRGVCPVCNGPFGDRQLVVDHAHVAGFKANKWKKRGDKRWRVRVMTPADRRIHVRGVLHAWCNGLVRKWLTEDRARSILAYLEAHRARSETSARG